METLRFDIQARDFNAAGAASRALKQHLKRIGAESDAVRRAMIAAYEAEMNVVIHAEGGMLEAMVDDHQVDVEVSDGGPGIPDVGAAMREGFSTASAEARALGFGAGLGLPNIERNSDRLRVTSEIGKGTRVSFTILLKPELGACGGRPSSLTTRPDLCTDCRRCVTACPTGAVRVRDGVPTVLRHLCIDCASCIAACPSGALAVAGAETAPALGGVRVVVPAGLLVDYRPFGDAAAVVAALRALGAADVVVTGGYEAALHAAVAARAATGDGPGPVISPVCPAVVGLMELRFPALLSYVAPFASPLEAAQSDLADGEVVFVASCPSQRSALLAQRATAQRAVTTPCRLREVVAPVLAGQTGARLAAAPDADRSGRDPAGPSCDAASVRFEAAGDHAADVLIVTGAAHVVDVLEQLENGLLEDVPAIEPYLCDGGCLGSPLFAGDPYVAAWRWAAADVDAEGRAHDRPQPFRPRPGIRLDPDMATAIRMLAELDDVTASLPGKDCATCGAPSCAAFAEDIVTGRATRDLCPYATLATSAGVRPDEGSPR